MARFAACAAVAWLGFVLYFGLGGRAVIHGDALEYMVQTQSMALFGSIRILPERSAEYWNATNPFSVRLGRTRPPADRLAEAFQSGGGFGGLYPDRRGEYRYYHFWLYSLAVAPLYLVLHFADGSRVAEYLSFRLFNMACLILPFALAWLRWRSVWVVVAASLALATPLLAYVDWAHPELFCLCLTFAAFWCAECRSAWRHAGPILLGLATSQNLPIGFFFPLHSVLGVAVNRPATRRDWAFWVAVYATGVCIGLSSTAYFWVYFSVGSVVSHIGLASLEYATLSRALDMFINPMVGALFFFPGCVVLVWLCARRCETGMFVLMAVSVFAAAWLSSSTSNFNSGQVGSVRYAVWILAPCWYFVVRSSPFGPGWARVCRALAGLFLCVACIVHFRLYGLAVKDISRFGGCRRAVPEVASLMRLVPYEGDIEVLVENIAGMELGRNTDFTGIYVWDMGEGRQVWVLSKAAIKRTRDIEWRDVPGSEHEYELKSRPRGSIGMNVEDGWHGMDLSDVRRYLGHPVFGEYVVVRTKGTMHKVRSDQRLVIRSLAMKQAPTRRR